MRQESDERIRLAPTDLSNFLSCRHLTRLDLDAALGLTKRPARYGPLLDELRARGMAHEKAYLAHLESRGLSVVDAGDGVSPDPSTQSALERTLAAMRCGVDVIYQAALADDTWAGRADFLRKVQSPSDFGPWSYEATDAKLARDTRAGTILQLSAYSFLLQKMQGACPECMHVVAPGREFAPISFRVDDYGAYVRLLQRGIGDSIRVPGDTYPELVGHCDFCAWWSGCEERRRGDDHLCYVAGIRKSQIQSLRTFGIERLADLARLEEVPDPPQGSGEALERIRNQASIQLQGREANAPRYELIELFDADHGLARLPEPTPDDIFLDFEGNHFAEAGVQEYLTGFLARGPDGGRFYAPLWALTLAEERQAFERFMDVALETRKRTPGAHIYHFAPYEPAALKRLMGRFATREVELDELLRGGAFVDLHGAVKHALIASVERYSLKDLEPFFGYVRKQAETGQERKAAKQARKVFDLIFDNDFTWFKATVGLAEARKERYKRCQ